MPFLPVTTDEVLEQFGTTQPDFVLVTGDAYVDHPSFGAAIMGRLLVAEGFSVGIIAQPDWKNSQSFGVFGKPRLAYLVTGGNIDSMVNHYAVSRKPRDTDAYSPGGQKGLRPDRAAMVYGNAIRQFQKDAVIILGGLEASLRRLAHYDYWDDKVRRSILLDASADLLVYGMGESQMVDIAHGLNNGIPASQLTFVKGTVYKAKTLDGVPDVIALPSFKEVAKSKEAYATSFNTQYKNTDAFTAKALAEPYPEGFVVQNPPAMPLSTSRLDRVYGLPYMYAAHPMYDGQGGVPALSEVKFSLISSRGCFGGCNFCALTFHQGRVVQSRSHASLVREGEKLTHEPDFKGYIHDVGGPTANFRHAACQKQATKGACTHKQCLFPAPCKHLDASHEDYLALLEKLRAIPKVKKVFIRSGLRFDYMLQEQDDAFLRALCQHHISGQLKVAPEHVSGKVLEAMGKPGLPVYNKFVEAYTHMNQKLGLNQFLVPYFMSSHPGCDLEAAVELAEYLRDTGIMPKQVQDFYPTPGTLSTAMYHTGLDPRYMAPIYVPKHSHEKALQRALLQYRLPQNHALVMEALKKAGRTDLIGFEKNCLIRPRVMASQNQGTKAKGLGKGLGKPAGAKGKGPQQPKKKKTIRNIHKKVK